MYNKAVDNYRHALQFVPECYKTLYMCYKAIDTYSALTKFVPECYKTQEMCDKADVSLYLILFLIGIKLKECATELFQKILL